MSDHVQRIRCTNCGEVNDSILKASGWCRACLRLHEIEPTLVLKTAKQVWRPGTRDLPQTTEKPPCPCGAKAARIGPLCPRCKGRQEAKQQQADADAIREMLATAAAKRAQDEYWRNLKRACPACKRETAPGSFCEFCSWPLTENARQHAADLRKAARTLASLDDLLAKQRKLLNDYSLMRAETASLRADLIDMRAEWMQASLPSTTRVNGHAVDVVTLSGNVVPKALS
jgi:hypothetical protein